MAYVTLEIKLVGNEKKKNGRYAGVSREGWRDGTLYMLHGRLLLWVASDDGNAWISISCFLEPCGGQMALYIYS